MNTTTTCQSGQATGIACSAEAEVTVEFMPEHLRASHRAAGNKGLYPHNGAVRIRCWSANKFDAITRAWDWALGN